MTETTNKCLACERDSQQVPLINMQFQNNEYWICPEHLPILIHKPSQLANKLPGAEQLSSGNHPDST